MWTQIYLLSYDGIAKKEFFRVYSYSTFDRANTNTYGWYMCSKRGNGIVESYFTSYRFINVRGYGIIRNKIWFSFKSKIPTLCSSSFFIVEICISCKSCLKAAFEPNLRRCNGGKIKTCLHHPVCQNFQHGVVLITAC